ncbi:hypothetical protein DUNSADRAFT_2528 [Dunaliella salina]|uniref:Uncharacterized protein n=1 Tax=Dunaliella salina TaxID=3046 RepID=A0ABQ7GVI3_DUNSA|nr:hypothetical protein DUNSADRAFT_2528 [Dunaliella salina]|eukprot:KAF5838619.1 hypothetical protein DUNSADRAFT_2528 [Dunaliella salina]
MRGYFEQSKSSNQRDLYSTLCSTQDTLVTKLMWLDDGELYAATTRQLADPARLSAEDEVENVTVVSGTLDAQLTYEPNVRICEGQSEEACNVRLSMPIDPGVFDSSKATLCARLEASKEGDGTYVAVGNITMEPFAGGAGPDAVTCVITKLGKHTVLQYGTTKDLSVRPGPPPGTGAPGPGTDAPPIGLEPEEGNDDESSDEETLLLGLAIGIPVGVVFLLALGSLGFLLLRRNRKREEDRKSPNKVAPEGDVPSAPSESGGSAHPLPPPMPFPDPPAENEHHTPSSYGSWMRESLDSLPLPFPVPPKTQGHPSSPRLSHAPAPSTPPPIADPRLSFSSETEPRTPSFAARPSLHPSFSRFPPLVQPLTMPKVARPIAGQPPGPPAALSAALAPPGTADYAQPTIITANDAEADDLGANLGTPGAAQHTISTANYADADNLAQPTISATNGADAEHLGSNQRTLPTTPTSEPDPPVPKAPSNRPSRVRAQLRASEKKHVPEGHAPHNLAPPIPQAPSGRPSRVQAWLHAPEKKQAMPGDGACEEDVLSDDLPPNVLPSDPPPPIPQAPSSRPSRVRAWLHAPEKKQAMSDVEMDDLPADELPPDHIPPLPQNSSSRPSRLHAHMQAPKKHKHSPEQQGAPFGQEPHDEMPGEDVSLDDLPAEELPPDHAPLLPQAPNGRPSRLHAHMQAPKKHKHSPEQREASDGRKSRDEIPPQIVAWPMAPVPATEATGPQAMSAATTAAAPPGGHAAAGEAAAVAGRPASTLIAPPPLPHAPSARPSRMRARLWTGKPERQAAEGPQTASPVTAPAHTPVNDVPAPTPHLAPPGAATAHTAVLHTPPTLQSPKGPQSASPEAAAAHTTAPNGAPAPPPQMASSGAATACTSELDAHAPPPGRPHTVPSGAAPAHTSAAHGMPATTPPAPPPLPQAPSKRPSRARARLAFVHSTASLNPVLHMHTCEGLEGEGHEVEAGESSREETAVEDPRPPPQTMPTNDDAWGGSNEGTEDSSMGDAAGGDPRPPPRSVPTTGNAWREREEEA